MTNARGSPDVGVTVDPAALRRTAAGLRGAAVPVDAERRAVSEAIQHGLYAAGPALPGPPVSDFASHWDRALGGVDDGLRRLADDVERVAAEHEAADRAAATGFGPPDSPLLDGPGLPPRPR